MEKSPQDYHPDLTPDRIQQAANLLISARNACNDFFDAENGDTNWSYGCRAREWTRQKFRDVVNKGTYPYLGIIEDSNQKFVLRIGEVPFKFFKEDVLDPTSRVMTVSFAEAKQMSLLALGGMNSSESLRWRLLIDTNHDREIIGAAFVGFNESEESVCFYSIPVQDLATQVTDADPIAKEGVELQAPNVAWKSKEVPSEEKKGGANAG
jgi:hypothetical protein